MADSQESLDFTVKLAETVADLKSGKVEIISVRCEEGQVLKIGRASKSDVVISSPGCSWVHAEMRLMPPTQDGQLRLGLRDISSNGTGLQLPGKTLERIPKGEDSWVPHGAMIALPMKMKAPTDQRFLSVHFGDADDESVPPPMAEAADETAAKAAAEDVAVKADGKDLPAKAKEAAIEIDIDSDSPVEEVKQAKTVDVEATAPGSNFASHLPTVATGAAPEAAAPKTNGVPHERDASDDEPQKKRARTDESESKPVQADPDGAGVGLPAARPPSGPPGVRPPPRGARPKGAAAPQRAVASSDVPAILREKIQVGENIIRSARDAEDRNQWGQAFDCYQRGLAHFMEVLPQLGKDSPGGINLRQQINGYLIKAGELKEKLERSKGFGCRKITRPRGPQSAQGC